MLLTDDHFSKFSKDTEKWGRPGKWSLPKGQSVKQPGALVSVVTPTLHLREALTLHLREALIHVSVMAVQDPGFK